MANPVRPYEHETSTSLIELNAVETKGVATAQPLAPYAFVCHTAAWPLSRVGKRSTAAAGPLSPLSQPMLLLFRCFVGAPSSLSFSPTP